MESSPVVLLEAVGIVVVRAEHGGGEECGQGRNGQPDQGEPLVSLVSCAFPLSSALWSHAVGTGSGCWARWTVSKARASIAQVTCRCQGPLADLVLAKAGELLALFVVLFDLPAHPGLGDELGGRRGEGGVGEEVAVLVVDLAPGQLFLLVLRRMSSQFAKPSAGCRPLTVTSKQVQR
jgi:hypothetical protein